MISRFAESDNYPRLQVFIHSSHAFDRQILLRSNGLDLVTGLYMGIHIFVNMEHFGINGLKLQLNFAPVCKAAVQATINSGQPLHPEHLALFVHRVDLESSAYSNNNLAGRLFRPEHHPSSNLFFLGCH